MRTNTRHFKTVRLASLGFIFIVLIIIYKTFNPQDFILFPKCPFFTVTGLQCPGCGSQRAIHYLLNLQFGKALNANPLMVLSIPYILALFALGHTYHLSPTLLKWRNRLNSKRVILSLLALIVLYTILRNIPNIPLHA